MPLNHYVSLGRSGLRVSPFALGAMTFGPELGPAGAPVEASHSILSKYLEAGGNFIDTANIYTRGHSEKIIGDFFKAQPGRRDRAVIATKFYGNLYPGDPNAGGSGRKAIYGALEQSLRRLQTDYVDLYWMHVYDQFTPLEETLRAVDDLIRAGKVRYFGISDTPAHKLATAQGLAQLRGFTPAIALQVEYSLLERTPEYELLPAAGELGMGVTPWGPLKSGALSGKYTRETSATAEGGRAEACACALHLAERCDHSRRAAGFSSGVRPRISACLGAAGDQRRERGGAPLRGAAGGTADAFARASRDVTCRGVTLRRAA